MRLDAGPPAASLAGAASKKTPVTSRRAGQLLMAYGFVPIATHYPSGDTP
jgi:hypothetical protein